MAVLIVMTLIFARADAMEWRGWRGHGWQHIYWIGLNPEQRTKADELQKKWESRLDHAADRFGTKSEK